MTDEAATARDIQRARKAEEVMQLLDDLGIYERIEAELVAHWKATQSDNPMERERTWHQVMANMKHRAMLQSAINDGKVAAAEHKQTIELGAQGRIYGVV